MLRRNNIELAGTRPFRDHHRYIQKDINDLVMAASSSGADALITTGKDAVKMKDLEFTVPCFVAEIETVIDAADEFRQLVLTSS
jgi:tetraacyldisaccharide-1-P 4'-kinase